MPRLLIELSGTEYDRLVAYARTLRRTPQQQAAQLIADTMAVLHEAPLEGVEQGVGTAAPSVGRDLAPQEALEAIRSVAVARSRSAP